MTSSKLTQLWNPEVPTNQLVRTSLRPLNEQGQLETPHSIEVKEFDERGITFHHRSPLNARRAMLLVESPRLGRIAVEVDLTWCQFNRTGRYTSGGRFVRSIGKTA